MAQNLIRLKQVDANELSGFFVSAALTTGFTGVIADMFNQNNKSLAYQFPPSTGIRRYLPLDLQSTSSTIPATGNISYFPFFIKKNISNPVACVELTSYVAPNPQIEIGIYSAGNGFENATLITSGSITGSANVVGIYRTTLRSDFKEGAYFVASMLSSGQNSSFRTAHTNGFREHFGINTGINFLPGTSATSTTNSILPMETGLTLKINIGTGIWNTSAGSWGPLVGLEY